MQAKRISWSLSLDPPPQLQSADIQALGNINAFQKKKQYLKSVFKGLCSTKINHTLIHSYLKTIHVGYRELPEAKYHHFGCSMLQLNTN